MRASVFRLLRFCLFVQLQTNRFQCNLTTHNILLLRVSSYKQYAMAYKQKLHFDGVHFVRLCISLLPVKHYCVVFTVNTITAGLTVKKIVRLASIGIGSCIQFRTILLPNIPVILQRIHLLLQISW